MKIVDNIEFKNINEILEIQSNLFKDTLKYVNKKSMYYKEVFLRNNIKIQDFNSIFDIHKLPFTNKNDLKKYNDKFYCCDTYDIFDIVHTSGSTGTKPIINVLTKSDLQRLGYNEKLSFLCAGVNEKDIFLISVSIDDFYIAGLAYYFGLESLGSGIIRSGPSNFDKHIELLTKISVTGIVGVPSLLIKLGQYIQENNISIDKINVNKLILIGETIRNINFELNELGKRLKHYWPNAELFSTYGNTEIATAFCECKVGKGGHNHPDLCFTEIIDENGKQVKHGEIGEIVITTFNTCGMPVLRYRTGDISFIIDEKCECGRKSLRIGPILGRKENMLKVNGVSIFPVTIEEILIKNNNVEDYIIRVFKKEDSYDQIIISILLKRDEYKDTGDKIREDIRIFSRATVSIEIVNKSELEKMQYKSGSRKPRRFIDER